MICPEQPHSNKENHYHLKERRSKYEFKIMFQGYR